MKRVLIGMLILMATASLSSAAVIVPVTATASDEYIVTGWITWPDKPYREPYMGCWVNGLAANVVNGSGFEERLGWHYNDGFREPGTMWIASMDPLPWIEFDLGAAQTLDRIKVWNGNHTGINNILEMGGSDGIPGPVFGKFERLDMGVQTMKVVLLDVLGVEIESYFKNNNVSLDRAPGVADDDFGQVINVATLNGGTPVAGVRFVRFDILENHGDPGNQVALSEVRFYNPDSAPTVDAGFDTPAEDYKIVSIVDNTPEPNSVTIALTGALTPVGVYNTTWSVDSADPNIIDDPNALTTTATFTSPGLYTFTLAADDYSQLVGGRRFGAYDTIKVRVLDVGGTVEHGWWPFNEGSGTTVFNSIEGDSLRNGTISGGPVWEADAGIFGGPAVRFNREGIISIRNQNYGSTTPGETDQYFDRLSSHMTASLWIKVDGTLSLPIDFTQVLPLVETPAWRLWIVGSRPTFQATASLTYEPAGEQVSIYHHVQNIGTTNVIDGNWHFIAFTYDGFSAKLYVNGRKEAEYFTYDGTILTEGLINPSIRIGSRSLNSRGFIGLMNDFRTYTVALTQDEIMDAYAESGFVKCNQLLDGDLDGNCVVNLEDFAILAQKWLQ